MKLDHFVLNIGEGYQKDVGTINAIRQAGFPYEPKWGKGTRGFKVSNLWIGSEYLEMVYIRRNDGGGWVPEWTQKYNEGHRGMICLMLDTEHMDDLYQSLSQKNIPVTAPKWLEFKWFFNLLTRRMPWRNCYLPFFQQVPLQIGFQEMKDQKSRDFMDQYMVPNSRDKGIHGVTKVAIQGPFTSGDFALLKTVFAAYIKEERERLLAFELPTKQVMEFAVEATYQVQIYTDSSKGRSVDIENVRVFC